MPLPHGGFDGFPDDSRAEVFVREFLTAVAPANRKNLATKPPLFILRVPGDAAQWEPAAHRVLEALRRSIDDSGRLVPYAHLTAGPDTELLSERAGTCLQVPPHMVPDRFPHFQVVRDLVTYLREHPARWPGARARELREHVCDRQQAERRGLLGRLPASEPPADTIRGWLLRVGWLSFTRGLPRRLWSWWTSGKVMRAWLADLPVAAGGRTLFAVLDQVAAVQAVRLRANPHHDEALRELEELLVRALLEDLRTPPVGGVLPRRRRRTARPVLLVELPPTGAQGARGAERFLRALHRMRDTVAQPGPLVIAVGQPSPGLLAELGGPPESNFTQAGLQLGQKDGPPVLVTFGEAALAGPGLPVGPVAPRTFQLSWRTTTSIVSALAALALLGAGLTVARTLPDPADRSCVGGSRSVAESARPTPVRMTPKAWYDAARKAIDAENERAERFAGQGRTVRTVVAFGSSRPRDETDALFDGTIPELRGIALWQRRLNDEAVSDDSLVPLRVEVRTTGEKFQDADQAARQLVEETRDEDVAGRKDHKKDYKKVVGVLGYAQSRDTTKAALRTLGAAGIPAVGTTATADEMLEGPASLNYWPSTPSNSTEARIEADFAGRENIVAAGGGNQNICSPAKRALVIESSADLYSKSLADKFRAEFPGPTSVFNFDQDGDFRFAPAGSTSVHSAVELANQLCRALRTDPDSVVYWSARARDFTAFINAMDLRGTCVDPDITILGGNDLTNVAMTGELSDKSWLRLYYSAHRMPLTDPRASARTRQFAKEYDHFVQTTAQGDDPWRQDGHSAVSYDAVHMLSQAVDQARLRDPDVKRESVLVALGAGVTFDGATGYVSYDQGSNAPPRDKTLVLLRQVAQQPEAVVACGAYRPDTSSRTTGAPCAR
ncbi:type 1 periplasmic-binding domain-containing protein [Streptomyces milbemycinicus]|uniref:ABC transporter substrate-binding protein n=1 Tax=Streptomyces milbemycinicus TaxID=476552 RepID=A0ABW8LLY7_9ACTN